jgi:hypothetical protein
MAIPDLLYEPECWMLTKQQMNRTEIAEMHFFGAVAGYCQLIKTKLRYKDTLTYNRCN